MKIHKIKVIYFSATGNSKNVACKFASYLEEYFSIQAEIFDITQPEKRREKIRCQQDELAIVAVPTYAGRVPNKVLPMIQNLLEGDQSPAIGLVTFGNRNYESSLTELKEELIKLGFIFFAGAAIVGQHPFSEKVGSRRPDEKDLLLLQEFAKKCIHVLEETETVEALQTPVITGHEPVMPYYKPLGLDGQPTVFLKAKPKTDEGLCAHCGVCASLCPMGSIDREDSTRVDGICIKCHACISACPNRAKYMDDTAFLSHVAMLERDYSGRAESEYFIS